MDMIYYKVPKNLLIEFLDAVEILSSGVAEDVDSRMTTYWKKTYNKVSKWKRKNKILMKSVNFADY